MIKRRRPAMGAGAMKAPAGRRQMPAGRKQRAVMKPAALNALANARPKARTPREQRGTMARKSWAGIPVLGPLIELLRSFVFRGEASRKYRRAPLGETTRSMITVRMKMAKDGQRPRYDTLKERHPVTAAKGSQYARKGSLSGVPRPGERKAA